MRAATLAVPLAALLAPAAPCAAVPLPDAPGIQAAYEAAYIATRGKPPGEHAEDLLIQAAHCQPLKPGPGAACQIDFVRQRDPDGRLYFDIVTLQQEKGGNGWVLRSGLCMTKPADRHAGLKSGAAAAGP
jgi:hypothetical protein